jgi:hypothetical protein
MPLTRRPLAARNAGPHVNVRSATAPALLSSEASAGLREEAALVERFVECYGRRFDALIRRLNAAPRATDGPASPDAQSLRLCVEAVSMMLVTHGQMARALRQLGTSANQPADPAAGEPAARLAA